MQWWRRAACAHEDPELFFPVGASGPLAVEQTRQAKAVCRRCPVTEECLRWALDTGVHGVCGGTSEEERRGRVTAGRTA